MLNPEITQTRTPTQEINPVFVNRWSPRGMTSEELDEDDLMALFEAARWAPSSYNNQPWRFIYAKRNTEAGKNFLACWLRVIRCGLRTQQLSLSLYLVKTLNIMENHQLLISLMQVLRGKIWH
jgi:nitroreductase